MPDPTWNLPKQLPNTDTLEVITSAISPVMPQTQGVQNAMSAGTATETLLENHADLQSLTRWEAETDEQYRKRVLAVFTGKFTTRERLEQHLSAIAGVPVIIEDLSTAKAAGVIYFDGSHSFDSSWNFQDNTYGVSGVAQINGSRVLNGSWTLGGRFIPGVYHVRITATPTIPQARLLQEFDRLRPIGTFPIVLFE